MRQLTRFIDTTVGGPWNAGPAMNIEGPLPMGQYPVLNIDGHPRLQNMPMFKSGTVDFGPNTKAYWTNLATGGCASICAAEVALLPRAVQWIFLFHGHGGNMGIDIAAQATNPANVYTVFLYNSSVNPTHNAHSEPKQYMENLDPTDQIPSANTLLIYGDFSSLAITPAAAIGVLPNNSDPVGPAAGGGGNRCMRCYISTAACAALGLADDCDELMQLRRFRDEILLKSHRGAQDVREYYAAAPGSSMRSTN